MGSWSSLSLEALCQFPAQHGGLRIRCCHSWGMGRSCGSDSIPGPGTSICPDAAKREKQINQSIRFCFFLFFFFKKNFRRDRFEAVRSHAEPLAQICELQAGEICPQTSERGIVLGTCCHLELIRNQKTQVGKGRGLLRTSPPSPKPCLQEYSIQ